MVLANPSDKKVSFYAGTSCLSTTMQKTHKGNHKHNHAQTHEPTFSSYQTLSHPYPYPHHTHTHMHMHMHMHIHTHTHTHMHTRLTWFGWPRTLCCSFPWPQTVCETPMCWNPRLVVVVNFEDAAVAAAAAAADCYFYLEDVFDQNTDHQPVGWKKALPMCRIGWKSTTIQLKEKHTPPLSQTRTNTAVLDPHQVFLHSFLVGASLLACVRAAPCCTHMRRVGQNRIYTPYMTVYMVNSLPKIPYTHRIYMVLANPTHVASLCPSCAQWVLVVRLCVLVLLVDSACVRIL